MPENPLLRARVATARHPVCVTAPSYDGRMFVYLLYDELKLSAGRASEIGAALMARLRSRG